MFSYPKLIHITCVRIYIHTYEYKTKGVGECERERWKGKVPVVVS